MKMPEKNRKRNVRITAGMMAVLLAWTGSFASGPLPAYASESNLSAAATGTEAEKTQSGTTGTGNLQSAITETEESPSITNGIEDFNAALGGIKKYFMKLGARESQTVIPGESLADATTSVSFDAADGYYYLVRLRPEPDTDPEKPNTAVQALDNGWIRKTGSGTYVWQNLAWNRNYDVYELNLSVSPTEMRKLGSAATNKGKVGGTLSIEGELLTGGKVRAVMENPTTQAGSWSWYTAGNPGADVWTLCTDGAAGSELTIPASAAGLYLKAVFTAETGGDFEGSLEIVSTVPAASQLTGVTITGPARIGEQLTASVLPAVCEPGVRYEWYRTASSATESTGGQFLYTGNPYAIQAEDIGNRLYVKAVSLPASVASGETVSILTGVVSSVPYGVPSAPEIKKTGATALTVGMPAGTDTAGLYEFGYSTQPDPDKTGAEFHTVTAKARGTGEVTIPELASSTVYYIWARRSGEGGFTDSPWSAASVTGITLPPALTGGLSLTGSCIYGETLTVSLTVPGQNGSFHWYRDGVEISGTGNPSHGDGTSSYQLGTGDIGKQLTITYQGQKEGSGSPASGELTMVSDTIEKQSQTAPVFSLSDGDVEKTDSSLTFTVPSEGEKKLKAGYAYSNTGVPVSRGGALNPGGQAVLTGLDRNTDYYLFLKYAESDTEKESVWSAAAGPFTTEKRSLSSDTIVFDLTAPHPGSRLTATLTSSRELGEIEGTWSWVEIVGGVTSPVAFTEDIGTPEETSYLIPDTAAVGTKYTVTFTGKDGMEGTVTGTSSPVSPVTTEQYPTPPAPQVKSSTDASMTVGMPDGTEGIYQFAYADGPDGGTTGWMEFGNTAYGSNSVTITGLVRNTNYDIRAKRLSSESGYTDSDWSASVRQKTGLTELGGSVAITGNAINGETLTASYTKASYLPTGDDTGGSFRWQKALSAVGFMINGEVQEPVYRDIPGAASQTYQLTKEDVNYRLKAIYTAPSDHGFTGEKSAETEVVKKTAQTSPQGGALEVGSSSADQILIRVKNLPTGGWYQIRTRSAEAPAAPELSVDAEALGWKQVTVGELETSKYYDPTVKAEVEMTPGTEYIIYTVYAGTEELQPSAVAAGTSLAAGYYQQTGTIVYTSSREDGGGIILSGGELKAELTGGNGSTGSWKWYVSSGLYSAGAPGSADWTYLPSGYYPINNSTTSSLTLTDDMVGRYVRAEFVADPSGNYEGTVGKTSRGEEYYPQYVKKIYKETLKIESNTTNGLGEPMAYAGSLLTGTIANYAESGGLDQNRTTVELLSNGVVMTGVSLSYSENTFTCRLTRNQEKAGQKITARVSKPKDLNLYVTETLGAVDGTALSSDVSTGTSLTYKDGIPIGTTEDLEALMSAGSAGGQSFASRTETYVLTDNIRCSKTISIPGSVFNGILDGDYHTITNIQNPLFYQVGNATVQNIIFNEANVRTSGTGEANSAAIIAKTASTGTTLLRKLFLSQANIYSVWDAAYFIGKTFSGANVKIEECGSAGGYLELKTNRAVAGMIGFEEENSEVTAESVFSYGTRVNAKGGYYGGIIITRGSFTGKDIVCASVASNINITYSGGVLGYYYGGATPIINLTNSYYDSTLTSSSYFPTGVPNGTPKETKELIGNQLKGVLADGTWVYEDGYYPRLSWLRDDPVAALFASTRGAFSSVDGATSPDDMFLGNISGAIEIPQELQREHYSFEASGDLSVEESGLITPVGTGGGTITISYDDGLYTAQNSYRFNTSTVPAQKKSFQSVTLSETANVQIGTVLTAEAQLDSADKVTDPNSITYQWYKRANGSTEKEIMDGVTGNTYTIKPTDAGYSFMALASADGYWDGGTAFTNTVTMTAPSSPPEVSVDDYQTVTVTGKGGALAMYEFAYSRTAAGEKIIVGYAADHPVTQTITGLEANTDYWFFSRVAAGQGYSAGPWSAGKQATTAPIPLEGTITLNGSRNVDTVLTAVMDDKNLQTGTWKTERVNGDTATELTEADGVTANGAYEVRYTLKAADVGSKIRFTFTANGKYTGSASAVSEEIEQSVYTAPATAPVFKTKTDTTVTLEAYSGVIATDLNTYEYGCQVGGGTITALSSTVEAVTSPAAEAGIRVRGLSRNTGYSFYVRKRADEGHVASNWSPALAVTTEKTDISAHGPLVFTIGGAAESSAVPTVEDVIKASVPTGIDGLTGTWSLEKESGSQAATLSGYTTAADGLSISYTLKAQEAGYTIRAVFKGTGDFTGEMKTNMAQAVTERRYPTPASGTFTVSGQTDSTVIVRLAEGLSGSYQFGKRLYGSGGDITECAGSVQQGNTYTVTGLERNTAYDIFVRRIWENGYLTSEWSSAVKGTTAKTEINGDIQITGTVEIGSQLTAVYQGGHYTQNGLSDDKGGTYTWKAGDSVIKTESEAQSTYSIKEGDRGKSISVDYAPPSGSDFKGTRTKLAGVVAKTATTPPAAPVLSPQTNEEAGSTLRITNAVPDAWYLPVISNGTSDTQPELVPESGAEAAGWIKASGTTLDLTGLAANTDYLIYGAHLETATKAASQLAVSARTRTLKEEIAKGAGGSGSTGITGPASLKPMDGDGTKVSIAVYGKAPSGTWNWYVAKEAGGSDGWKIIRSEKHEEEAGAAEASDTYPIPYEYSGYYLKVEFQADGGYTGQETWLPSGRIADREITGTVTVTPDQESGNQRLFEALTAAYGGSDDLSGTWVWYREDETNPSGWTAIRSEFYTSAGPASSYTPTGEDIGKKLKAEYTAASFGCTGSSETVTGAMGPAIQNQPAAPKVMRISGTNITLSDSDPGKAGPYGTRPEAVFGYRKTSEPESPVTWIESGALASQLSPSTEYHFYTKYKATETYMESQSSDATTAETGAGQLYQSYLSLAYDLTGGEEKKLDAGRTVTAVYQGEGWDKGSFHLKRSDGQAIAAGYQEQKEEETETVRCSYQLPLDMAGFSLIFTYTALEESGYSGSVEIKTGAVTKPAGDTPAAPVLEKHLDTDCYLTNVTDGQEYALLKAADGGGAPEEPVRHSSLWQTLTADENGRWRYTGLERGTTYYVYTRTMETAEREVSASVISNPVTTESFLYMGDLTLKNEKDLHIQPMAVSGPMEIPTTLNGKLIMESVRVVETGGSGDIAPFSATESLSEFVTDADGGTRYLNPNVYEKGSTWANRHFATTLELSGIGGQYAELEESGQSTFQPGDTMVLSIYRANAVTVGGSYIWEITLKDDEGTEALLKAEVTIVTQLEATVPLQIGLQIRDQELLQTTNGAGLKNSNGMPVEVFINEKPQVKTDNDMPTLCGKPTEDNPEFMPDGAVYLMVSVDGSIETNQMTEVWLDTTLTEDRIIRLVKLGASSQADYYISGMISANGKVKWPWQSEDEHTVQQAYGLKFVYEISADGYPVYTPKISSPDSITVSQEGGES